jgi:hypothetical protein
MDVIDRPVFQFGGIFAVAQRRGGGWHHRGWDACDITRSRAVNMSAEDSRDPA